VSAAAVTRRRFVTTAVLTGGLTLGAAGCSWHDPFAGSTTPATASARPSADVALAVRAAAAIAAARALAVATTTAHPPLAVRLAGFAAMHTAHLEALARAVPAHVAHVDPTAAPTGVPVHGTAAVELARVQDAERSLHDTLTALAMTAESGLFARVLGSMAAAISQRLVVDAG